MNFGLNERDIQKYSMTLFMSTIINGDRMIAFKFGSGSFRSKNSDGAERFIKMTGGFNQGNGIPDCLVMYKNKQNCCRHVWVEFKVPGGHLSESQRRVALELAKLGSIMFVCRSMDDAQKIVEFIKTYDDKGEPLDMQVENFKTIELEAFDTPKSKPRKPRERAWKINDCTKIQSKAVGDSK